MESYQKLVHTILHDGVDRMDRTGVGTRSIFGYDLRIPLDRFPLLTTKKVHFKSVVAELLWFLQGSTNIRALQAQNVHIWDEWASPSGDLGPVYGFQWRSWPTADGQSIDQISQLLAQLKTHPHSRRLIVSAWNVSMLEQMALPPCHVMFQCYSHEGRLSLKVTQRSADVFLGLPFNIASYALLCHMLAHVTDHQAHELIWSGGDCHLYHNHFNVAEIQCTRTPRPLPELRLDPSVQSLFDFTAAHIQLVDYIPHGPLKAPVAV